MTTLIVAATSAEAAYVPEGLAVEIVGIGKAEAAVRTAAALVNHRPSRLINIGTAGALRTGLHGIIVPSAAINHDFTADAIRAMGFDAVDRCELADGDGSVLASGDQFVSSTQVRERLAKRADIVDMEGFAIARAAEVFGVACQLVKVVSDEADEHAIDWPAQVDRCARQLGSWLQSNLGSLHD